MAGAAYASLAAGAAAGIYRICTLIKKSFDEASSQRAIQLNSIRDLYISQIASLELRYDQRHQENIERLTRLETIVLNGQRPRRKRA